MSLHVHWHGRRDQCCGMICQWKCVDVKKLNIYTYVCLGLLRICPSSVTMPTPILFCRTLNAENDCLAIPRHLYYTFNFTFIFKQCGTSFGLEYGAGTPRICGFCWLYQQRHLSSRLGKKDFDMSTLIEPRETIPSVSQAKVSL